MVPDTAAVNVSGAAVAGAVRFAIAGPVGGVLLGALGGRTKLLATVVLKDGTSMLCELTKKEFSILKREECAPSENAGAERP